MHDAGLGLGESPSCTRVVASRPAVIVGASTGAAAPTATRRSCSRGRSPAAAAIAARPRSPADGKRSSGSFASARATTVVELGGTRGTRSLGFGGSSDRCAHSLRLVALALERRRGR